MALIKQYPEGSNITLLNTIYLKPQKDEDGKYGSDYMYIIYRDMNTGEKKFELIKDPKYTFFVTNNDVPVPHNKLFIEKSKVHPVTCKFRDLKLTMAEVTNNKDWFFDNLRTGNYKNNDKLFNLPSVFMADMNIEDYYRFEFDREYQNVPFKPSKLYFDIETDIINMEGDFPEPGECPVNACTIVDDDNHKIYVLLLENYDNPLIEEFKKEANLPNQLKDFVRSSVGGWKEEVRFGLDKFEYKLAFFNKEINLIRTIFNIINKIEPDFALAWNIAFDLPYLIARCYRLGYNPKSIICHPDMEQQYCDYFIDRRADKFEQRGDYATITCKTVYLDQLITFASRRKGQRAISSFKLDNVGYLMAGVHKLDYSHITTSIAKLPYLDYKTFVFYNCMDTIVQLCIEHKVQDIDFVYTKSIAANTRYAKIHRQTTYLINIGVKKFWDDGYIMGNNINKNNQKEGFAGAFVADPTLISHKPKMKINGSPINIVHNADDFDYARMYPSAMDENNMAPNTMHGKILFSEKIDKKENRFNNPYFDRSTWFVEDLVGKHVLDFCSRYLHLPTYVELFDDIIKYYHSIKNPKRGLRDINFHGIRIMYHILADNKQKRQMYTLNKNPKKKKPMIRLTGRMPKYDKNPNKRSDAN